MNAWGARQPIKSFAGAIQKKVCATFFRIRITGTSAEWCSSFKATKGSSAATLIIGLKTLFAGVPPAVPQTEYGRHYLQNGKFQRYAVC